MSERNKQLQERIHLLLSARFGASSERVSAAQLGLFNEAEATPADEECVPVLNNLRAWLDEMRPKVAPKTKLGEALTYLDNNWAGLIAYCDEGRYHIDNNTIESHIRPFCVGRRAWLFADTPAGAMASARLYSLVRSAKANKLDPYAYLRHVFTELPKAQSL